MRQARSDLRLSNQGTEALDYSVEEPIGLALAKVKPAAAGALAPGQPAAATVRIRCRGNGSHRGSVTVLANNEPNPAQRVQIYEPRWRCNCKKKGSLWGDPHIIPFDGGRFTSTAPTRTAGASARRSPSSTTRRASAAGVAEPRDVLEACILDVHVTGDETLAVAALNAATPSEGVYAHDQGALVAVVDADGGAHGWWNEAPSRKPSKDAGELEFRVVGGELVGRWRYGQSGAWRACRFAPNARPLPAGLIERFGERATFLPPP